MSRLLSIGRFAQLVGLSVSALRFYAECGLLPPARVDQDSGYRYYTEEQVPLGQQIAALRQLQLPLDDLALFLEAGPEGGHEILERHEGRLYGQFQAQRHLLRQVGERLSGGRTLPEVPVRYDRWPAQVVLSLTGSAPAESFNDFYLGALAELRRQADDAGVEVTGEDFGLYHEGEYLGGPLQVEVCLPVAHVLSIRPHLRVLHLPAAPVAAALHQGDWRTFSQTFAAIHADAVRSGHTPGSAYTLRREPGMELGFLLH